MLARRATAPSTSRRRCSRGRRARRSSSPTTPSIYPHQAIDRDEWERMSERQDAYIAETEMIQVDGFIGDDPEHRVPTRLFVEAAFANIAGMQDVLYFHDADADFEPELVVVYTPGLAAAGYPDDRLIAVNLDLHVTRVFNSDYFGESKKGGLRMWNKLVHDRGGLALHAGCKIIPTPRRRPGRADRRPLRHRQDDDHLHAPERVAAGPGRLRRVVARRLGLGDRGRLLRKDVRAQPEGRAHHLRRRHPPERVPREREPVRRRRGRLLRPGLHAERPRGLRVRRHRGGRRRRGRPGRLPARS